MNIGERYRTRLTRKTKSLNIEGKLATVKKVYSRYLFVQIDSDIYKLTRKDLEETKIDPKIFIASDKYIKALNHPIWGFLQAYPSTSDTLPVSSRVELDCIQAIIRRKISFLILDFGPIKYFVNTEHNLVFSVEPVTAGEMVAHSDFSELFSYFEEYTEYSFSTLLRILEEVSIRLCRCKEGSPYIQGGNLLCSCGRKLLGGNGPC